MKHSSPGLAAGALLYILDAHTREPTAQAVQNGQFIVSANGIRPLMLKGSQTPIIDHIEVLLFLPHTTKKFTLCRKNIINSVDIWYYIWYYYI